MNPHKSDDLHSRVLSDRHNWQSIETAPRDGTSIVGWRQNAGIVMIRFGCLADFLTVNQLEQLDPDEYQVAWEEDWFSLDVFGGQRLEGDEIPTHWVLPKATEDMTTHEHNTMPVRADLHDSSWAEKAMLHPLDQLATLSDWLVRHEPDLYWGAPDQKTATLVINLLNQWRPTSQEAR